MTVKCLITGCQLRGPEFIQRGDLFELGECYVFNACGEPQYVWGMRDLAPHAVVLSDPGHQNYFERRNVYVFNKADARLTPEATAYIAKGVR